MTSRPYFRYLVVGGIVGLLAIAAREILAYMFPDDSPGYYLLSVIIIYAGGIVASFYGHFHVSFSHVKDKSATLVSMFKFTLVALAGMGATATLSYQIRYNLGLEAIFGPFLPSLAFGMAALTASLLTYSLNARYIFVKHTHDMDSKDKINQRRFLSE